MKKRYLSKSKLMAARQCLKRVYLEVNHPTLAVITAETEQAFAFGNAVGDVAQQIYATDDAVTIPYEGGLGHALRKTRRLLAGGPRFPIFEATVEHDGVLVRVDALLPVGDAWHMVEVKASTSEKPEHAFDCAIQSWVLRNAGHAIESVALAHIDNQFVYPGEGDFSGLLTEAPQTARAAGFDADMPAFIRAARAAIAGDEPDIAVGGHCFSPYACPFVTHCWPSDVEHPLFELPRANKGKLASFVASGYRDLRDVPGELLTDNQRRVQQAATSGEANIQPDAGRFMRGLAYPRYYLDFESINSPIPVFAGTRPYQALPFQWSCHYEAAAGALEHAEFLDLSGDPPFRRLAESLIRGLGKAGPILTYSPYENRMLNELLGLFPDLREPLEALAARLVDLKPVVAAYYYHPEMRGSWSIKALLPQVAPDLDYSKLEGIQEGNAASSGYLEAIDPATGEARKAELEAQLRRYCKLDTEAMVRLVRFFERH